MNVRRAAGAGLLSNVSGIDFRKPRMVSVIIKVYLSCAINNIERKKLTAVTISTAPDC